MYSGVNPSLSFVMMCKSSTALYAHATPVSPLAKGFCYSNHMNETTIRLNFRVISAVLLIIIIAMFVWWRPWQSVGAQTISMTGEASVKAAPDEFVFYPTYQKEGTTSTEAISAVSKVGNDVVAKLKELGVEEKAIKTSTNSQPDYAKPYIGIPERETTDPAGYLATYSLTVTLQDKDVAQKALDYLVTTSPLYGVSPQSTFSAETRKKLEAEARSQAVADAETKAKQTADELEVSVGRVVSVSEPSWGGAIPISAPQGREIALDASAPTTSPVLLTGEETVTYSVTVVFRLR